MLLHGFVDSDWAGDASEWKSTSSYCFSLGTSMISSFNGKHATVAHSLAEADYNRYILKMLLLLSKITSKYNKDSYIIQTTGEPRKYRSMKARRALIWAWDPQGGTR